MDAPTIATERLTLTRLDPADAEAVLRYRSDPGVWRYQTWAPTTLDEARTFVDDLATVAFGTPGTWFQFGMRLGDTGDLVGDLGLHFSADDPGEVEIGVTLAPEHQGRGLASEAVRGAFGLVFRELGAQRAVASVDPRNTASVALLTRVGMRQVAFLPASFLLRGEWTDDAVFALTSGEWRELTEAPAPE
jgi:RimJ/RimL family protein N-acetyltransferase